MAGMSMVATRRSASVFTRVSSLVIRPAFSVAPRSVGAARS